ncbi:HEPACAM family member 2 [Phascolarctos cinereus]|uniref:HEPACAM family member 2 n=1 Tax=Phascolarctos cinereus TaxID=38626 RepID=A0A6P5JJ05_PHACI|nr:HEPACAM family member 2 [Phascolarctos cinereus]
MEPTERPRHWRGVLRCQLCYLLLGTCSGLTVTVPSATVHGVRGHALYLPVIYSFQTPASDVQIIWLFQRPRTTPKYLLGSVNRSVVPDLEYRHKFAMMPPNASLRIQPLHFSDEGTYIVKVNVNMRGNGTVSAHQKILVTVDDPVTKPTVHTHPSSGAVENVGNLTLTCVVGTGTRVTYQWLKDEKPVQAGTTYIFSLNRSILHIAPVTKADIGEFRCLARNAVSEMWSEALAPVIYYGPYGLTVNSDRGLRVGEVFTVDLGEAVRFDCSADSNPPNIYLWIQRDNNSTQVIEHGPHLEVASEHMGRSTDYTCCAYNNMTGRRGEARFTVIITSLGLEKVTSKGKSSLAIITGISVFLIVAMSSLFLWKKCRPYKIIHQGRTGRSESEYGKAQTFSGHEDALADFGIYEFVAFPEPSTAPRIPSRPICGSEWSPRQEVHGTIYEVIQHVPGQEQQGHPE